jgi:hypothetical protein
MKPSMQVGNTGDIDDNDGASSGGESL